MNYRLYQPPDFDALYAIEEQCFQPLLRFPRRYMRHIVGSADAVTWIVEAEGRMAGFAVAEWQRRRGRKLAYILTLEVLSEQRGQGIGSELLRRIESSARAAEATAIRLHVDEENTGAIRLYEAHGYLAAGREENFYADHHAALIYEKPFPEQSDCRLAGLAHPAENG